MDFDYLQEQYDNFNRQALDSTLVIFATINIKGKEISGESLYPGAPEIIDGRQNKLIKLKYPSGLNSSYKIEVYITDKTGLSLKDSNQYDYSNVTVKEPYDIWISCFKSKVLTVGENTYFDYADTIDIQGINYIIKGVVKENFGNKPLLHIFLVKNYEK